GLMRVEVLLRDQARLVLGETPRLPVRPRELQDALAVVELPVLLVAVRLRSAERLREDRGVVRDREPIGRELAPLAVAVVRVRRDRVGAGRGGLRLELGGDGASLVERELREHARAARDARLARRAARRRRDTS